MSAAELLPAGFPLNDHLTRYYVNYGMGPGAYWFIDKESRPRRGEPRFTIWEPGGTPPTGFSRSPCAAERGQARTLRAAVDEARRLMTERGLIHHPVVEPEEVPA